MCDQTDLDAFDCGGDNIVDSCESIPDCDNNGLIDVCEILADPGLDLDGVSGLDQCQPKIVHGAKEVSFSAHAFSGYIDPRAESTDGINVNLGIDRISIVFTEKMSRLGGGAPQADDFDVTVTGEGRARCRGRRRDGQPENRCHS